MANGSRSGTRMSKQWGGLSSGTSSLTGDGTSIISGSLAFLESSTILRMIGEYLICGDSTAPVAADGVVLTVGIGVFSTDAVTAGSASMLDPGDEPEFPWLYWAAHSLFFPDTSQNVSLGARAVRRDFDVRSMRKMKPRESLVAVVQYANVAGNPPLRVQWGQTRVLVGQH